jgi:putative SOS response-associated peptidase YedK
MPVILAPAEYERWLDAANHDAASTADLLRPCDGDTLCAFEVSAAVNRPANDTPVCCEPVS